MTDLGIIIEYPAHLDFVFLHQNKVTNSLTFVFELKYNNGSLPKPFLK